jgi:hypothetical protein
MIIPVSSPNETHSETPGVHARGPRAWWQGLAPRQRRALRVLLLVCAVVVLVVGALLARFLSVENAERADVTALVQAQARGDLAGMLARLDGCRDSSSCRAAAKADASDPRLHRSGAVKILQLESPTAYSLSSASGRTRVAWTVIGTLPVVQCVDVRRSGSFLAGIHVHLLAISAPISGEGRCTKPSRLEREEEEETRAAQ